MIILIDLIPNKSKINHTDCIIADVTNTKRSPAAREIYPDITRVLVVTKNAATAQIFSIVSF